MSDAPVKRGERLKASMINAIVAGVARNIRGGPGILVTKKGGSIVIQLGRKKGAVGNVGQPLYKATSKANLPSDVEAEALGFVTAGSGQGHYYRRNADNDAWVPDSHLEPL